MPSAMEEFEAVNWNPKRIWWYAGNFGQDHHISNLKEAASDGYTDFMK